jgi:hypothetical protein
VKSGGRSSFVKIRALSVYGWGAQLKQRQLPGQNGGLLKTGLQVAAIELVVAWLQSDVTFSTMVFAVH